MRGKPQYLPSAVENHKLRFEHDSAVDLERLTSVGLHPAKAVCIQCTGSADGKLLIAHMAVKLTAGRSIGL